MKTLAETILELSTEHVKNGGLIMGQNLEAVQNVCGTVPVGEPGVEVMPTCEAAGIGISIGAALTGRPVVHVIRFASFLWLQSSPLVYYAARAKSEWGYDLPLLIRVSSDDGIGPTHSGVYHSPFLHMPGLKVAAPMTPTEYREIWHEWQETKQPVLVSEHRRSYAGVLDQPMIANAVEPQVIIIAISAARIDALAALPILSQNSISAEVYPIYKLNLDGMEMLKLAARVRRAKRAVIVDSGYVPCSLSEHIACRLNTLLSDDGVEIAILGVGEPPTVGHNGSPSPGEIAATAIGLCADVA